MAGHYWLPLKRADCSRYQPFAVRRLAQHVSAPDQERHHWRANCRWSYSFRALLWNARLSRYSTKLFPNTRNFFPIPSASLPSNFLPITQRPKKCCRSTLKPLLTFWIKLFGFDKANQIQQTAKNSFGIVLASSSFALIIRQYLELSLKLAATLKNFLPCPSLSLMPDFILNRVSRANLWWANV